VMFGMFYIVTLYLQFVQGYSPLSAAVHQLPFAITMLVVSPQGPRLVARFGARTMVTFGLAVQALGFVVLSTLGPDTSYGVLLVGRGWGSS
ncbi:MAG: MFS transporter, partial [Iamia sp.]